MAEISTDLKKSARDVSIALLGPVLASAADLMLSTKEAHWNVRGPNFMSIHLLFDKLNEEVSVYVDDVAERIVQMGGYAHGTLRDTVGATLLPAYPEKIHREKDHLEALIGRFVTFGKVVRKGIDTADLAGDKDSADLLTQVSRGLDKQIWFLEAHLA
jgi:starvation-inducible DNA-binding protein